MCWVISAFPIRNQKAGLVRICRSSSNLPGPCCPRHGTPTCVEWQYDADLQQYEDEHCRSLKPLAGHQPVLIRLSGRGLGPERL